MIEEEPVFAFPGVAWDWTSIGGYREAVARARPATNVTTMVGHNTLRRFVIGGADRPPTAAELERMRSLVREAIDEGARGFTTGLSYAPGLFASVEELAALAGVAAERGLMYHTHMRYGDLDVRGSVAEAIDTAERAGVDPQHLAHVPAREPAARGSRHPAGHARRRPGARPRGDLRPDDVPARRWRVGPVAAGLGARRRERRDGGDHPRPGLPGAPDRGAVEPGRFLAGGLGRPGHLQGEPAGERAPQRPDDRRAGPRARPGADRHRARPGRSRTASSGSPRRSRTRVTSTG